MSGSHRWVVLFRRQSNPACSVRVPAVRRAQTLPAITASIALPMTNLHLVSRPYYRVHQLASQAARARNSSPGGAARAAPQGPAALTVARPIAALNDRTKAAPMICTGIVDKWPTRTRDMIPQNSVPGRAGVSAGSAPSGSGFAKGWGRAVGGGTGTPRGGRRSEW
jgi:hypothetical protein